MSAFTNILLVVTDQQRADTIHALGNPTIRTPVLDRLVRQGTSFDRAFTPSPVCVSARCGLLTGLPPHVTGCVDNFGIPRDIPNLPTRLGKLGYQTCGVGKMHFSPDQYGPWGFDHRDTSEEEPGPGDDYVEFLKENGYGHVAEPHGVRSEYYYVPQPSQLPAHLHHTHWVADRSIDFLRKRDRNRPFFLMASFIKPHPPFENPLPFSKLYRTPAMKPADYRAGDEAYWTYWNRAQNRFKYFDGGRDTLMERTRRAAYYGCISFIDQQLGRILSALGDDLDDTLVIFTSDHGEFLGDYGCVGKRSMLQPACAVPMIASLPGRIPAGQRVRVPTTLLDVMPTCLRLAGEAHWHVHEEGEDLVHLAQRPTDFQSRTVYSQYQRGRFALYMAATAEEKIIRSAPDEKTWYLTVTADPMRETMVNDLIGKAAMESRLIDRFEQADYTQAVDGRGWTRYEPPVLPESPDAGLLVQDTSAVVESLEEIPQYVNSATRPVKDPYLLLRTPDPFRKPSVVRPTVPAPSPGPVNHRLVPATPN